MCEIERVCVRDRVSVCPRNEPSEDIAFLFMVLNHFRVCRQTCVPVEWRTPFTGGTSLIIKSQGSREGGREREM